MKVRIGVGLGGLNSDRFLGAVQQMERRGFDSLWLSEVLTTGVVDPLSGLAFAAGVTHKLKLGTTMTVTARNPVRMAKELATIDQLLGWSTAAGLRTRADQSTRRSSARHPGPSGAPGSTKYCH